MVFTKFVWGEAPDHWGGREQKSASEGLGEQVSLWGDAAKGLHVLIEKSPLVRKKREKNKEKNNICPMLYVLVSTKQAIIIKHKLTNIIARLSHRH